MALDAGLSSPSHPPVIATKIPSQPIHGGTVRVLRTAAAYSGTTTPQPSALPA
jgi:hypothetical protein